MFAVAVERKATEYCNLSVAVVFELVVVAAAVFRIANQSWLYTCDRTGWLRGSTLRRLDRLGYLEKTSLYKSGLRRIGNSQTDLADDIIYFSIPLTETTFK